MASPQVLLLTGVCGTERLFRTTGGHQLAWWLRQHDYSVQVIDFTVQMSDADLVRLIEHFVTKETKIIGWSTIGTMVNTVGQTKRFVEKYLPKLRERYPWVVFITGGPGVHYATNRYPNKTGFDYHFFGYAENGVLALCNQVFRKGKIILPERKNGNMVIRETTPCPISMEDQFNIKRLDHKWADEDCILPGESLPIEIGRGCIFKCKFCAFPHIGKRKGEYLREMQHIEEEMLDNYARFGTTNYYLVDDTFNDDPDKVRAFYDLTQRLPFKINVGCFMRADLLEAHPETPELLAESGFVAAYFGVESFNEQAAKFVAKPWSHRSGQNYLQKLRKDIWKDQVSFRVSMIIGLPGDTRKDYIRWHRWFVENDIPNWSWHPLLLERDTNAPWNSEIDRNAEEYGYTWVVENGQPMWKHKESGVTWRDALELWNEFEALKAQYQVNNCFGLMEEVQYCNLDPKVHNFVKIKDVDHAAVHIERQANLQLYIQKLLAL